MNIKVTTSGEGNYAGSELTKTLTIQRADLTAGYEAGQLHIFILDFVDQGGEEIPGYGWVEGDDEHSIPEVRNNIGGGAVTITYWTDAGCTVPTTTAHGATATNDMPEKMGLYYIKAEIAESDLFNAITSPIRIPEPISKNVIT